MVSIEKMCASIIFCPFGVQAIKLRPNLIATIAFFIWMYLIFENRAQSYKIRLKKRLHRLNLSIIAD